MLSRDVEFLEVRARTDATFNKILHDIHDFVEWVYDNKDRLYKQNTTELCQVSPTKFKSPFTESNTYNEDVERFISLLLVQEG